MIKLYCGLDDTRWNLHNINLGNNICIAPVYGNSKKRKYETRADVPIGTKEIIQDSGAFSDSTDSRLSFRDALLRQEYHAEKYHYDHLITHRASYDMLIDETWLDTGERRKIRWSDVDGWRAVNVTINANKYLNNNRGRYGCIFSAQGVNSNQYYTCAKEIIPLFEDGDIFGFGGWCIIGKKKNNLKKDFYNTIVKVVPLLNDNGIKKAHIWGVMYAPALGELLWLCDKYNIQLSTDSSGPQRLPIYGNWGYADWKLKPYKIPQNSNKWIERGKHVMACIEWLDGFRKTKYYKEPNINEKWSR